MEDTKMSTSPSFRAGPNLDVSKPAPYGAEYFEWQSKIGRFGGWANLSKFSPYIREDMKVLDFGAGGGYLLANIRCASKVGVEINPVTRAEAARNGVNTVQSVSDVEDGWADIIISTTHLNIVLTPSGSSRVYSRN